MNLLKTIITRSSVRDYSNKDISNRILKKILNAGIWGPSLSSLQVARFIVIKNKFKKGQISNLIENKLGEMGICGRAMFLPTTLQAIKSCNILIAIYSSCEFQAVIEKFSVKIGKLPKNNHYIKLAKQAEISAISAAIQNMILMIENLALGSCWLHMPLYCEEEINKILKIKKINRLVAMLAVGYPKSKVSRSPRKTHSQLVETII
jgi:nitroreductase